MRHKHSLPKKLFIIPPALLLILLIGGYIYFSVYYHASGYVEDCLAGTDDVDVVPVRQGLFLDGPGEEKALIFYPGAKVEYTAYVPLLTSLASEGMDCFLVDMPLNFAFFGMNRASGIMKDYNYREWILGGHSLGGVVAAMYTAGHDLDGLVLLAAYPVKTVDEPTLELYGSEDKVLNLKERKKGDRYLPEGSEVEMIEGGNHAQFGDYGEQKGDGAAKISREEQQKLTVQKIMDFL